MYFSPRFTWILPRNRAIHTKYSLYEDFTRFTLVQIFNFN